MVAGNSDDLVGIVAIRPVEAFAVVLLLARTINDVAQVKQKRRVERARARLVVGRHIVCDLFGILRMTDAAVAERV